MSLFRKRRADLCCAFCRRHQRDVRKLIAGPGSFAACDVCIRDAVDLLKAPSERWRGSLSLPPDPHSLSCSFCGRSPSGFASAVVASEGAAVLCTPCLDLMLDIVAEELDREV